MRVHYWSNSDLANRIRGTVKPKAETSKGWREWDAVAKKAHPLRFWIAEEFLDMLQNTVYWPLDRLYTVKYWINNRFVTKTHTLTSFSLKKGEWHEFDERMLHCLFDELVNFVTIEQAWMSVVFSETAEKEYNTPWYATGWFRWRTWRCEKAGVDHLKWASSLVMDDEWADKDDPNYGQPTPQAIQAKEILELYNWWTRIRPEREDPHDTSGWSAICDQRGFSLGGIGDETPEEQELTAAALNKTNIIEQDYHNEDTEMLIRLINIRRALWT